MAFQTMLYGMKCFITGTQNFHVIIRYPKCFDPERILRERSLLKWIGGGGWRNSQILVHWNLAPLGTRALKTCLPSKSDKISHHSHFISYYSSSMVLCMIGNWLDMVGINLPSLKMVTSNSHLSLITWFYVTVHLLYILSRASEVGSPTNPPWAPGSDKTRGKKETNRTFDPLFSKAGWAWHVPIYWK